MMRRDRRGEMGVAVWAGLAQGGRGAPRGGGVEAARTQGRGDRHAFAPAPPPTFTDLRFCRPKTGDARRALETNCDLQCKAEHGSQACAERCAERWDPVNKICVPIAECKDCSDVLRPDDFAQVASWV